MELPRRTLLQGATALSALGVVSLQACSAASDTSSGTTTQSIDLDAAAWNYDATNDVYWQIGLYYVTTPQATDYETLGIYVPGKYFTGTKNDDDTYTTTVNPSGAVGSFTAATAPVVLPVNTPGYAAQKPPSSYTYTDVQAYMEAGFVYVQAGLRGKDSNTDSYVGNAPWGVTDLKAAVRYLRYNGDLVPGDKDAMFVFGHSGGGAQSSIMGSSGDSDLYTPYLEALGAAMTDGDGATISDAVAGAMCWCPITSLDHGDAAYEWNMGQFATDGTRASGTWTEAYSKDLAAAFAGHLNDLGLKDSSGTTLTLAESSDGVYLSGSYYDHMVEAVTTSLNDFLSDTTFPYTPTNSFMAGMGGSGGGGGSMPTDGATSGAMPTGAVPSGDASAMAGGTGGPGASASSTESTTYKTVQDYIDYLNTDETWVTYDSATNTAKVTDLGGFVRSQKSPSKDVGAFDAPDRSATENVVLGKGTDGLHFSPAASAVMAAGESGYASIDGWSDDYAASTYTSDVATTDTVGTTVSDRLTMYTPLNYLNATYDGFGTSTVAPHWRIRTGIMQGDTACTTEMNLALALQALDDVEDVDFAMVWGQGHTMAERTGEAEANFITWVTDTVAG